MTDNTPTPMIQIEECPGDFEWSAFGARYPDTVCSKHLVWNEGAEPGSATLCDADDDFRPKDIACPFHEWATFTEYEFGGGYIVPLCDVDEKRLPNGTEIHCHDGRSLWWSATCPEHGEQRVLMRDMSEVEGFDEATFEDWKVLA